MLETFFSNFETRGPDDCWVWTGRTVTGGYGTLHIPKTMGGGDIGAHRFSHILFRGPLVDGLSVLHRCDNPPCVNPRHLHLGTPGQNLIDAIEKDRLGHKLKWTDARRMRELYAAGGRTHQSLAEEFDVNKSTVGRIVRGDLWPASLDPIQEK